MQRRAAAVYAVFLLLVAVGAYAVIGVAQEPAVTIQNPERSLSTGDTLTADGREYAVSEIAAGTNEGDDLRSADLTWVNDSARFTTTWDNGSTVTRDGTEFTVAVPAGEDPTAATLREIRTLGENVTTTEIEGVTYVVLGAGDDRTIVPREEYLDRQQGPAETRSVAEGDRMEIDADGATVTARVADVSAAGVTFAWTGQRENTVSVSEGGNVTLGGTQYVAHFPDNATLELSTDVTGYVDQRRTIAKYHERINGLWAITILSGFAAIILLGMAYLPSRY